MSVKQKIVFLDASTLDYGDIDRRIREQDTRIDDLCKQNPEIDRAINKLDTNQRLNEDERDYLVREVDRYLRNN